MSKTFIACIETKSTRSIHRLKEADRLRRAQRDRAGAAPVAIVHRAERLERAIIAQCCTAGSMRSTTACCISSSRSRPAATVDVVLSATGRRRLVIGRSQAGPSTGDTTRAEASISTITSAHLDHDIPAGVVVFLVALPLCLGIAVASGAPPFSGVIAGIIGGLVVSDRQRLATQRFRSCRRPYGHRRRGGREARLRRHAARRRAVRPASSSPWAFCAPASSAPIFPSAVIKGMLAAIGLILIMKQLPHAVGYDADAEQRSVLPRGRQSHRAVVRLGTR